MVKNEQFLLSDEQLRKLSAWIDERSTAWAKDDDQFSLEVTVSFSFSIRGRSVVAKMDGTSVLNIEDALGDC